jgi:hypothetical protein
MIKWLLSLFNKDEEDSDDCQIVEDMYVFSFSKDGEVEQVPYKPEDDIGIGSAL